MRPLDIVAAVAEWSQNSDPLSELQVRNCHCFPGKVNENSSFCKDFCHRSDSHKTAIQNGWVEGATGQNRSHFKQLWKYYDAKHNK